MIPEGIAIARQVAPLVRDAGSTPLPPTIHDAQIEQARQLSRGPIYKTVGLVGGVAAAVILVGALARILPPTPAPKKTKGKKA